MFMSDSGPDYSAPGLDSLHWAGVKKRPEFDQRSIASSMNAERDDKSIYEEPAVGAVEGKGSWIGLLHRAGDPLRLPTCDRATIFTLKLIVAEEDHEDEVPEEIVLGLAGTTLSDGQAGGDGAPPLAPHQTDERDPHDRPSPRDGLRRTASSQAMSTDAENNSIRPTSEDGELEDVALDALSSRGTGSGPTHMRPRSSGNHFPASSSAAPSSAASPRSPGMPPSPLSRASMDFEAMNSASPGQRGTEGRETKPLPIGNAQPYQSYLMRRATGGAPEHGSEGPDTEMDLGSSGASASASAAASLTGSMPRTEGSGVAAPPSVAAPASIESDQRAQVGDHPLAVAKDEEEARVAPAATPAPGPVQSSAAEAAALPTSTPPAAAAPAPQADAVSPPAGANPAVNLGSEWEKIFKGLLYMDGMDALGRPVVVLNADAVPARMKSSALTYVKAHLEPLVSKGQYVIVFTARKAKLPSLWIMGAYQTLPRPYRKNVQYVVLVRPSAFLKAVLKFMRPFVSNKAGRKIKVVEDVTELGDATGGEVTMHHLGAAFLEADAAAQQAQAAGP